MIDSTGPGTRSQAVFAPLFAEASAAAVALRVATGRKIVGYLGAGVPVEIIAAAGLIPFRIGIFRPDLNSVQRFLEMGDSDVVALLANALLDGSYDFLDHVVVGNTPTFNITLFHFLRESRRLDPAFPAPPMSFHEIHHGDSETIATFNTESCRRLADQLGEIGSRVTDASLLTAIERTNARRNEIAQLKTLRRQLPPSISGTEALAAIARWQLMPQIALSEPPRQIHELPRVLFSGSDVGNFNHYAVVEAAGCTIIADDHDWGEEALLGNVATNDAFSAIAARYANQTPRAARWSRQKRITSLVERAVDAKVDGVVFWISDEDQASSWDVPALTTALGAHGISALDLGKQPAIDFDESTIVATLRRWLYGLSQKHSFEVA